MAADKLAGKNVPLLNLSNQVFDVAGLPDAATYKYRIVVCTDGDAGALTLAFSDGTNWKVIDLGATCATS